MHRRNPQHAVLPLGDALHHVVRQSVGHTIGLERHLSVLVHVAPVQSVAVAAYPQRTVFGAAETRYLVDDATLRVVELVLQLTVGEGAVPRVSLSCGGSLPPAFQVYDHCTFQASHPQLSRWQDDAADALAIAICHAQCSGTRLRTLLNQRNQGSGKS